MYYIDKSRIEILNLNGVPLTDFKYRIVDMGLVKSWLFLLEHVGLMVDSGDIIGMASSNNMGLIKETLKYVPDNEVTLIPFVLTASFCLDARNEELADIIWDFCVERQVDKECVLIPLAGVYPGKLRKLADTGYVPNLGSSVICALIKDTDEYDLVKYLHEKGWPWDARACDASVMRNNLELLKYLREEDCPWNSDLYRYGVAVTDMEILEYLYENGCPLDSTSFIPIDLDLIDECDTIKLKQCIKYVLKLVGTYDICDILRSMYKPHRFVLFNVFKEIIFDNGQADFTGLERLLESLDQNPCLDIIARSLYELHMAGFKFTHEQMILFIRLIGKIISTTDETQQMNMIRFNPIFAKSALIRIIRSYIVPKKITFEEDFRFRFTYLRVLRQLMCAPPNPMTGSDGGFIYQLVEKNFNTRHGIESHQN